jgi:hypothetical protein
MVDDLPGSIVPDDPDCLRIVVILLFLVHKTERIRKWFAIDSNFKQPWLVWLLVLFLFLRGADSSKVSDERTTPTESNLPELVTEPGLEEVIPTPKKACLCLAFCCCSRTARLVSELRPQKLRPSQRRIAK